MGQVQPLTKAEREQIYEGKLQGKTQADLAQELGRSIYTVRKWWRRVRDEGGPGLACRKRGRKPDGILSTFEAKMVDKALHLKQKHRRWGPDRVLVELAQVEGFSEPMLPHRSRLAQFYKEKCPACVGSWHRLEPSNAPPKPAAYTKCGRSTIKRAMLWPMAPSPPFVIFGTLWERPCWPVALLPSPPLNIGAN